MLSGQMQQWGCNAKERTVQGTKEKDNKKKGKAQVFVPSIT
jgi:hypothetical protein